jgi:predicted DNA-binding protein with PD1-like motif
MSSLSRAALVGSVLALGIVVASSFQRNTSVTAAQTATQITTRPGLTADGYITREFRPGSGAPGMKVIDLGKGARTFRVTFAKGDEFMSGMADFAEKQHIKNAHFTGIGAIGKGSLFGWPDPQDMARGQRKIELTQDGEIVSLLGSISADAQGRPNVHAHGSVAFSDGSVKGGHWWEAHVTTMIQVFVTEEEGAAASPIAAR